MKKQATITSKKASIIENDTCLHIVLDDADTSMNDSTHVDVSIIHKNGYIDVYALRMEFILVYGKTTEHTCFEKIDPTYIKIGHVRKFNWSKFKYENIEYNYVLGSDGGTFIPTKKEFWKKVKYESSNYIISDKNE
jgi:hypothetical protein